MDRGEMLTEATNEAAHVTVMRAVIEYLVELDGYSDYLPTLLQSSLLRSPVLAG